MHRAGIQHSKDVTQWMEVANRIYGDSTSMVVHGISMGAATDPDMIDLMNEPPTMITNNTGTIIQRSLLSGNPEKSRPK